MLLKLKTNHATLSILEHVKRGSKVYDIGANVGVFSSSFAVIAGPKGQVHSFEPVASNFEQLLAVQRSYPWIKAYNLILSDTVGKTEICIPGDDAAQSSIKVLDWGNWKTAATIKKETRPCTTLDTFIRTEKIPVPDFIKIDTEGAELKVLRGAEKTLTRHFPKIYMELNPETLRGFGAKPSDLMALLKKYGYNRFEAVTHKGIIRHVTDADILCQNYFSPDLVGWKT
jgi:FkbM family methyltransferase